MSARLKLAKPYLPVGVRSIRKNWYVSRYLQSEPIHLFRTMADAITWASEQPADIVGGVDMVASLDWFNPGDNPREAIARNREYVDHRI